MKKIFAIFTLMFAVLLGGTILAQDTPPASAGGGGGWITPIVDAEQAGYALSLAGQWVEARGWMNYLRVPAVGDAKNISVEFTLNRAGWITYLKWDGVVIVGPGDKPIGMLPNDELGAMTQLWMSVVAMGKKPINGWFYTDNLLPSAPIVIELCPGWEQQLFRNPTGTDLTGTRLVLSNGSYFSYDPNSDGYWIWLDPLNGDEIIWEIQRTEPNGSVTIIARGSVVWNGNPSASNGSAVATKNIGDVVDAYMDPDGTCFLPDLQFISEVKRGGGMQKALVLRTNANDEAFFISASGFQGNLEVRDPNQKMKLIREKATAPGQTWAVVDLPSGYRELVITVLGVSEGWGLSVYVSGTYVPLVIPPIIIGGGGGMGVVTPTE